MSTARRFTGVLAFASLAMLTGCPGKSASSIGPHDVAYYNTHLQERQATLDRCAGLDQVSQAADADCKAALYSSLYGPSQLKATATP
jgi:hypothetical protein